MSILMDSSLIDSADDQTFHLIRFPKEILNNCDKTATTKAGSVFVYHDGRIEYQDDKSHKIYSLLNNSQHLDPSLPSPKKEIRRQQLVPNEESDLFRISLQTGNEAVHLGKVKPSTWLVVPKVDETGASTVCD